VATRPFGASFADWMGKPQSVGGLGVGDGVVAAVLTVVIFVLVAYLGITRRDVQLTARAPRAARLASAGRPHKRAPGLTDGPRRWRRDRIALPRRAFAPD
jgi:hypothetical protein